MNWGSSTQGQTYVSALKSTLDLASTEEHVKNYRPQILVLSGTPASRPPLIDFANLITKNISLLVCGHVLTVSITRNLISYFYLKISTNINHMKIKLLHFSVQERFKQCFFFVD